MSMLNTNFTAETQTTNTKEESKMENLKEEMLNIYNLVNESSLSKKKKAAITNSLTAIKETLKQMCKENEAIKKQYVSSIKPRPTTIPELPEPTPKENTRHYYKPNMKFIPRNIGWLMDNTAYPLITSNENYILNKEDTPHPNESAPDLLEYHVVYRPLAELQEDTKYNKLFKSYIYDGTPIKDILNTIANKILNDEPITEEYKKYINSVELFKEAVFIGLIKL